MHSGGWTGCRRSGKGQVKIVYWRLEGSDDLIGFRAAQVSAQADIYHGRIVRFYRALAHQRQHLSVEC